MIGRFLTRHSPVLMLASILTGLALPDLAAALRPWVVPVSVVMVPLSVLRVDMRRLGEALRTPTTVLLAAAVVLIGVPLAVGAIASAAGLPGWLATGLVLVAAAPPLSSSAAFSILLRTDAALVTAISLCATFAAPATLWLVAAALPEIGAGIETTALVAWLAGLIAFAFCIAFAVRGLCGEDRLRRAAPGIDAAIVTLVLVIGVGVMHEIGQALRADPALGFAVFGATWALSVLSCGVAVGAFWWAGRDFALAVGVVAAVKNIALMVAAVAQVAEPDILLVVMTAQLPIFLMPLVMRSIFGRILHAKQAKAARDTRFVRTNN